MKTINDNKYAQTATEQQNATPTKIKCRLGVLVDLDNRDNVMFQLMMLCYTVLPHMKVSQEDKKRFRKAMKNKDYNEAQEIVKKWFGFNIAK